jgi:hypothetical protein
MFREYFIKVIIRNLCFGNISKKSPWNVLALTGLKPRFQQAAGTFGMEDFRVRWLPTPAKVCGIDTAQPASRESFLTESLSGMMA